jgi:hypothetical protein
MPLFFNHHFLGGLGVWGGGGMAIILSFVGTYQSDLLIGPFFFLVHFCAL